MKKMFQPVVTGLVHQFNKASLNDANPDDCASFLEEASYMPKSIDFSPPPASLYANFSRRVGFMMPTIAQAESSKGRPNFRRQPLLNEVEQQAFVDMSVQSVQNMRAFRDIYRFFSDSQTTDYDNIVKTIAEDVATNMDLSTWREADIIETIHEYSLDRGYPRIYLIDSDYKQYVQESINDGHSFIDRTIVYPNDLWRQFIVASEDTIIESSGAKVSYTLLDQDNPKKGYKITVDGADIVELTPQVSENEESSVLLYACRSPIISSCKKTTDTPVRFFSSGDFQKNGHIIEKHLNLIATKLLNGEFNNQDEAIDLLVDYKFLNSLPFSIQNMGGSQFKNIIKLELLVATVKAKFSSKVSKHLTVPYPQYDSDMTSMNNICASPEWAAILKSPAAFRKTEREQIAIATKEQAYRHYQSKKSTHNEKPVPSVKR